MTLIVQNNDETSNLYQLFQREDAMLGAFLEPVSEDYLGVIAKQYGDPVIVRKTSDFYF